MEPLTAIVVAGVVCAAISGAIARRKGLSVPFFAFLGLFLSWVGVLIALLTRSPNREAPAPTQEDIELDAAKRKILEGI